MNINYIFDSKGLPEYAVVPIEIWQKMNQQLSNNNDKQNKVRKFDPSNYKGLIRKQNIDLEKEISDMRSEWTRNF